MTNECRMVCDVPGCDVIVTVSMDARSVGASTLLRHLRVDHGITIKDLTAWGLLIRRMPARDRS